MATLSATDLRQFLWCPRTVFFNRELGIRPLLTGSMKLGSSNSQQKEELLKRRRFKKYGFSRVKVLLEQNLHSASMGISGICDAVLETDLGFFPIEIKTGDTVYHRHKIQLAVYGLLLNENGMDCSDGFILLLGSDNLVKVQLEGDLFAEAGKLIKECKELVENDFIPEGTEDRKKCSNCEYNKFCPDRW